MYIYSVFKKILTILNKKQKRNFFLLTILMLLSGLLETIGISLFIPIVYVLIDGNILYSNKTLQSICKLIGIYSQQQFLFYGFLILGLLYILKNIYLYFQLMIQNNYVYNNRARFFDKVYSIYLNKNYCYYVDNSSGSITRSIYYDVVYTFDILLNFINIFTECIICFLILMFLFFVNWLISLIAGIVLLSELLIINKVIKPILIDNGKINLSNSSSFLGNIIQSIESIKEIKVFNTENYFINKNKKFVDAISKSEKFYKTFSSLPKLIIEACTFGILSFSLALLVKFGINVKLLIPSLSAFAVAAVKLLPSLNKISANLSNISYYTSNLDNLISVVNSDKNNVYKRIDKKNNILDFKHKIEFKNLFFKYDKSNRYIFENLNFEIFPNKSIGIVGGSGEGKTTLVDLLTGLLIPSSGVILCDGINIRNNYNDWLSLIGYIPQNTTLINDTIRANVAFGVDIDAIDEEKVISSLKDAQIYDIVCDMENGLDTKIGDRGIKLSGGQRQRIGIARALYKNPKILIFDEATSALDNNTEKEVMKSINDLMNKKTIIIIAHRLSTLQNCDIIYRVLNSKVLVEE